MSIFSCEGTISAPYTFSIVFDNIVAKLMSVRNFGEISHFTISHDILMAGGYFEILSDPIYLKRQFNKKNVLGSLQQGEGAAVPVGPCSSTPGYT